MAQKNPNFLLKRAVFFLFNKLYARFLLFFLQKSVSSQCFYDKTNFYILKL